MMEAITVSQTEGRPQGIPPVLGQPQLNRCFVTSCSYFMMHVGLLEVLKMLVDYWEINIMKAK